LIATISLPNALWILSLRTSLRHVDYLKNTLINMLHNIATSLGRVLNCCRPNRVATLASLAALLVISTAIATAGPVPKKVKDVAAAVRATRPKGSYHQKMTETVSGGPYNAVRRTESSTTWSSHRGYRRDPSAAAYSATLQANQPQVHMTINMDSVIDLIATTESGSTEAVVDSVSLKRPHYRIEAVQSNAPNATRAILYVDPDSSLINHVALVVGGRVFALADFTWQAADGGWLLASATVTHSDGTIIRQDFGSPEPISSLPIP
jgi:hypothetical protein